MKNRLAILVAGTMVVCSLTACGGTTSMPKDNTIAETTTAKDNTTAEATTESLAESDWYQGVLNSSCPPQSGNHLRCHPIKIQVVHD